MHIIIRDDDISFFTKPEMLDMIYANCWDNRIPVCLSVVPLHSADTEACGLDYEPNIPPKYRGSMKEHSVKENTSLCTFLNDKIKQGLVEICQHGLRHKKKDDVSEFNIKDRETIKNNLISGKRILEDAFPSAKINIFVSPFDALSPETIDILLRMKYTISTTSINFLKIPKVYLQNRNRIHIANDYYFSPILTKSKPKKCFEFARKKFEEHCKKNKDIAIINHYWSFYNDWREPNMELVGYWHKFIDYILTKDVNFTTFQRK